MLLQLRLAAVAAVEHRHVETEAATTGDGRADIAQADDAQGLAVDIGAEQLRADRGFPLAGLGPGIQFGGPAGTAHDQGEGHVGSAFGQHVGGIGEHDPALAEVGHVIVVVADRDTGDHFKLAGVFQLGTPQFAADTDQPVGVGQGFLELGIDIAELGVRDNHVEILAQALDHGRGDAAEGEYGFFHRKAHRTAGMPSTLSFFSGFVRWILLPPSPASRLPQVGVSTQVIVMRKKLVGAGLPAKASG